MGLGHNEFGNNGTETQWIWYTMGLIHNEYGTEWDWDTMSLVHNGTDAQ